MSDGVDLRGLAAARDPGDQCFECLVGKGFQVWCDGAERRREVGTVDDVVPADHGDVVRDADAVVDQGPDQPYREQVAGTNLEDKYAVVRSVGFDGIELSARGDGAFAGRLDELKRARDAGVVMPTAVVHMDHFIGDFDEHCRRDAVEQLKSMLTTIAAIDGLGIVSPHAFGLFSRRLPPFDPPRSVADSQALLIKTLTEVGDHAAEVGAQVFLEPLNRFEDFVINTLADAAAIVDAVGSPGVAITADTFHMSIEEARIADSIEQAGSRIGHVQLGDSNRLEPGAGHYDWPETLAALEGIGYGGWLAMECGLTAPAIDVLPGVAALLR